jgi:tRNA A-37 threonylcarbamoyl transferase component Bud32
MEEFLHDPDRYMSSADSHMLKDGNSSTVKRIVVNGQKFIVKRYNIKNVLHLLRRLIQPTRAAISWTNANYLMHIGIKTAAPVALIEQRWGPFRGKAYFVMRELGGIDAREYFAQAQDINENLAERINNMVELLYCMHHNRISHGDMKATNFIISDSTVQVIDLDAMKIHNKNTLFRKSWKRDMRRFSRNWHQHPDLARLFREQLDKEGLTANE